MIFTKKAPEISPVATEPRFGSINDYLVDRAIKLESTGVNDERYHNPSLAVFARRLAELQLKGGDPFLKYIRTAIVQKDCRCNFSLNHLTHDEQEACIDIANLFCSIGGLINATECHGVIHGKFSLTSPKLINFINGDFLEVAIYSMTKHILSECALDYELLPNAVCTVKKEKKEYDMLLRVGKEFYVFEIKSGRTDKLIDKADIFDYYRKRGIELGMYPDHQLFITGDHTEDEVMLISYFQNIAIANYNTFQEKLLLMINKQ